MVATVPETLQPGHSSTAIVTIKNTSKIASAQVLQLYISAPNSQTSRPAKELHGFEKVFLEAGEERQVHIHIDRYATSFWDEIESMWKSEAGIYNVLVGDSSQHILAKGRLVVPETYFWLGL